MYDNHLHRVAFRKYSMTKSEKSANFYLMLIPSFFISQEGKMVFTCKKCLNLCFWDGKLIYDTKSGIQGQDHAQKSRSLSKNMVTDFICSKPFSVTELTMTLTFEFDLDLQSHFEHHKYIPENISSHISCKFKSFSLQRIHLFAERVLNLLGNTCHDLRS